MKCFVLVYLCVFLCLFVDLYVFPCLLDDCVLQMRAHTHTPALKLPCFSQFAYVCVRVRCILFADTSNETIYILKKFIKMLLRTLRILDSIVSNSVENVCVLVCCVWVWCGYNVHFPSSLSPLLTRVAVFTGGCGGGRGAVLLALAAFLLLITECLAALHSLIYVFDCISIKIVVLFISVSVQTELPSFLFVVFCWIEAHFFIWLKIHLHSAFDRIRPFLWTSFVRYSSALDVYYKTKFVSLHVRSLIDVRDR